MMYKIRMAKIRLFRCIPFVFTSTVSIMIGISIVPQIIPRISKIIGENNALDFASASGLTVRSSSLLNAQLYQVILSSEEVLGDQIIHIIVPTDYTTSSPNRRYPVLYLLHGAYGNPISWMTRGAAQNITSSLSLITVMPNADPCSYYTNWIIPRNFTPQNWRTYHMEQLVPWIDFNLRTIAKKQGRAIAGLSMGGYGAIHYAERYPNNFIYAASFSGAVNILDKRLQQRILNYHSDYGRPFIGPFGDPSALNDTNGWITEDTLVLAAELRNVTVALYTGNVDMPETLLRDGSYRLRDVLESLNISCYFNDYGDGKSIGHDCDGSHSWSCWKAALIDVLPRMMAVLEQKY